MKEDGFLQQQQQQHQQQQQGTRPSYDYDDYDEDSVFEGAADCDDYDSQSAAAFTPRSAVTPLSAFTPMRVGDPCTPLTSFQPSETETERERERVEKEEKRREGVAGASAPAALPAPGAKEEGSLTHSEAGRRERESSTVNGCTSPDAHKVSDWRQGWRTVAHLLLGAPH